MITRDHLKNIVIRLLVTAFFVGLKLSNMVDVPWMIVFFPIWVPAVYLLMLFGYMHFKQMKGGA